MQPFFGAIKADFGGVIHQSRYGRLEVRYASDSQFSSDRAATNLDLHRLEYDINLNLLGIWGMGNPQNPSRWYCMLIFFRSYLPQITS